MKKDIADMIEMGVIRESDLPYASPVVVVKKKDNINQVCVDYRKLNILTVINPETMPTVEHLFQHRRPKLTLRGKVKCNLHITYVTCQCRVTGDR